MDVIITLLSQYGYWGMLLAAFLAGSFFPFSSEAVMVALMATGLDPWLLMVYGTIGNVLGSIFNYTLGRMGKMEWIEKYLHVKGRPRQSPPFYGRPWLMDGLLCLPTSFGLGHHDCLRTHAFQYHHHIYRHHIRKDFPLYRPHLWCWFVHITLIYVEQP